MTEANAIKLCLNDQDPIGFEYLVEQYKREAYYHAYSFTNNKEDAADACQDSFRKAFSAMPKLKALDQFYPWFYRILKNHCINLTARKSTTKKYYETARVETSPQANAHPATAMETAEQKEQIRKVLQTLKPDFREILTLKYFSEKNYDEISELLEIPRGTVMSRLYHARKAFGTAYQATEKNP